ncbi:hypothetical protein DL98DRAFT_596901 [Cadophora sp. DSE1049]|nr:hypothetical protein DL98DRAFT_596901 [Cadophora sp. DSE1049]
MGNASDDPDTEQADLLRQLERPLAKLCQFVHMARLNSPMTKAFDSVPSAIRRVVTAGQATTNVTDSQSGQFSLLYQCIRASWQGEGACVDYIAASRSILDKLIREYPSLVVYLLDSFNNLAGKRNLFSTSTGHIGSGPPNTMEGDVVSYIVGVPVPMILRKVDDQEVYVVIGPAYMLDLIDGELFREESLETVTLV